MTIPVVLGVDSQGQAIYSNPTGVKLGYLQQITDHPGRRASESRLQGTRKFQYDWGYHAAPTGSGLLAQVIVRQVFEGDPETFGIPVAFVSNEQHWTLRDLTAEELRHYGVTEAVAG